MNGIRCRVTASRNCLGDIPSSNGAVASVTTGVMIEVCSEAGFREFFAVIADREATATSRLADVSRQRPIASLYPARSITAATASFISRWLTVE